MPYPNNNYGNQFSFGNSFLGNGQSMWQPQNRMPQIPSGGFNPWRQPQRPKIQVPLTRGVGTQLNMGQANYDAGRPPITRIPKMGAGFMSLPPEGPAQMVPLGNNSRQPFYGGSSFKNDEPNFGGSSFHQIPDRQQPMGESSFQNRRTWTPQEAAQMAMMNRQQDAQQQKEWYQWKNPNWRYDPNVDEINRQADVMERRQLPDVNDPNWKPNDWKDNLTDIPGSMWGQYRDRFNAIEKNRQAAPPQQETMLSQVPSGQFPNYAEQLKQANPTMAENINNPTYMGDNRITPMPRAGNLTPQEAAQMRAVGSSIGEWNAKADWMRSKGYEGQMTPAQSQEYTNMRQAAQLERNAKAFDVEQQRNAVADIRRQRKLANREQNFRYNNPELFANVNPNAAQFLGMLSGAPLRQFSPDGQMTPRDNLAFNLQYRNQLLDQLQMYTEAGDAEGANAVRQQIQGIDSSMQNATVFDGTTPGQGMPPQNPYRRFGRPPQPAPAPQPQTNPYGYGPYQGYGPGVPMMSF